METKEIVEINSVVQINEKGQAGWMGCLVQVTEIKNWGLQGYVQIPKGGFACVRLKWEEVDYIGQAVMIQENTPQ